MKKLFIVILLVFGLTCQALAWEIETNVYQRQMGGYAQTYHQKSSDNNLFNNYSTKGNTNPYTNREEMADPFKSQNQMNDFQNQLFQGNQRLHRR